MAASNSTESVFNATRPTPAQIARNVSQTLDMLLENYDKRFRPEFYGGPMDINVTIHVLSIGPINDGDSEFSMDCYFRQTWFDERLRFGGGHTTLSLNAVKFLRQIWKPDTYIRNGRDSYLHNLTTPNKLLRLASHGAVLISQRLTIKTKCPMYLRKFPMDTQSCTVEIGSFGYPTEEMNYHWKGVSVAKNVTLSQYELTAYITGHSSSPAQYNVYETMSTLILKFKLRRQQGYYFLQVYVPCMMSVGLSWVSFWIHKDASPARVSLGIMTVLTMCTLSLGGRGFLPKISYSTALDYYIVVCFGFVFAALVEYAVVNFANQIYWKQRHRNKRAKNAFLAGLMGLASDLTRDNEMQKQVQLLKEAMTVSQAPKPHISDMADGDFDMELVHSTATEESALEGFKRFQVSRVGPEPNETPAAAELDTFDEREFNRKQGDNMQTVDPGSGYRHFLRSNARTGVDYIDDFSKIAFPLLYLLFNGVYWISYLLYIPDEIDELWNVEQMENITDSLYGNG